MIFRQRAHYLSSVLSFQFRNLSTTDINAKVEQIIKHAKNASAFASIGKNSISDSADKAFHSYRPWNDMMGLRGDNPINQRGADGQMRDYDSLCSKLEDKGGPIKGGLPEDHASIYDSRDQPIPLIEACGRYIFSTFPSLAEQLSIDLAERLLSMSEKQRWAGPTALQLAAIPILRAGHDAMLLAPTGCGKTVAYLVPALEISLREVLRGRSPGHLLESFISKEKSQGDLCRNCELSIHDTPVCPITGRPHPAASDDTEASLDDIQQARGMHTSPRSLILVPTHVLVSQVYKVALLLSPSKLRIGYLHKADNPKDTDRMMKAFENCDVLVCTPEVIARFLLSKKVSLTKLRFLVIDEIASMLELPQYDAVRLVLSHLPRGAARPQRVFVGASLSRIAREAARKELLPSHRLVLSGLSLLDVDGGSNARLTHTVIMTARMERIDRLRWLYDTGRVRADQRTVIFCNSAATVQYVTEQLRKALSQYNVNILMLHGKMTIEAQHIALKALSKGATTCLVCTDIVSRGLDLDKVVYVVNFDMPLELDSWINRVGRCGRRGRPGYTFSLFAPENIRLAQPLLKFLRRHRQVVPARLAELAHEGVATALAEGSFFHPDARPSPRSQDYAGVTGRPAPRYKHLEDGRKGRAHERPLT